MLMVNWLLARKVESIGYKPLIVGQKIVTDTSN